MTYNCLVADDFVVQRNVLSKLIKRIPQLKLVSVCEDGLEAALIIAKGNIDIVFCDINMPSLSGIGLLHSLTDPPVFVFITAHGGYAVESFDLEIADFMLKPVEPDRFLKAVHRAMALVDAKRAANTNGVTRLIGGVEAIATGADDHFFIKESHGVTRLKYSDVLYIESLGDFSKIHTLSDQKHILLSGLKDLEGQLPSSMFIRVHKQFIANLSNVLTITPTGMLFVNKQAIGVGATYRKALLDTFMSKEVLKRKFIP